jgi:hypothetical protein
MYNVNNINAYFELSNVFNMHTQKVVYNMNYFGFLKILDIKK